MGAMPVHSESRQPTISSSSARPSSACSLTSLLQAGLDRVAVDAAVLEVELVDPVLDVADRVARDQPERDRLAAAAVLLARPGLREVRVGRGDRARVLEWLATPLLAEDLVDHAASTASRTHRSCSRNRRRKASRSSVFGPWPVTTCLSSSQSGSEYSQTPSLRLRSLGSGTSSPSSRVCGTYPWRNCCRASSFPCDLIRHRYIGSSSLAIGLPWNCMSGPHQRLSASCTSSNCSGVPVTMPRITSRLGRTWNDASQ